MLKALGNIKNPEFIAFDRDSNAKDIQQRLLNNPDYADIYDGDLYQNSTQMIINIFSFLFEKNAEYFNKSVFEGFLHKCRSEKSIYDHLKEKHLNSIQATEACIDIEAVCLNSAYMRNNVHIPLYTKVYATGLDGSRIPFEFISYDPTKGYDYRNNVVIKPTIESNDWFSTKLYSGETFIEEIEIPASGVEHITFDLNNHKNIIENSIQVYYKANNKYYKLERTNSFVSELTHDEEGLFVESNGQSGKPLYMLNYTANGSASITFGSSEFGGIIPPALYQNGETLVIYGRKNGGGKYANIVQGALSTSLVLSDISGNEFTVKITNITNGSGGHDRETAIEAQTNAPLRYGRGGAIVNDIDAKNALKTIAVKHNIITSVPDGETPQLVPILHAYHQIVPKDRDFNNFVFPDVINGDSALSYLSRFLKKLNEFCNIQGINAEPVVQEELINHFNCENNNYDFIMPLSTVSSIPFYGTLYVDALDKNGNIVDRIQWLGSYQRDTVASATSSEHAFFTTSLLTSSSIDFSNKQTRLIFSLGQDTSLRFDIEIPKNIYSFTSLADILQEKIIQQINANASLNQVFSAYTDTFIFVTYSLETSSTGKLTFHSPFVGAQSKIIFWASNTSDTVHTTELYTLFGIVMVNKNTQSKPYRPLYQTGLVFDSNNIYTPNDSGKQKISFKFKTAGTDNQIYSWVGDDIQHNQSSSEALGPKLALTVYEDDFTTPSCLQEDKTVVLRFWKNTDTVETHYFNDVQYVDNNIITLNNASNIITDKTQLDLTTGTVNLQFINGEEQKKSVQSYPEIIAISIYQLDESGNRLSSPAPLLFSGNSAQWSQDPFSTTAPIWTTASLPSLVDGTSYDIVFYTINNVEVYALSITYDADSATTAHGSVYFTTMYPSATIIVANASDVILSVDKKLTIQFFAPTESNETFYKSVVSSFDKIQLSYDRKSYNSLAMSYTPNKYNPVGEAAVVTGLLKAQQKRLLSMEHLLQPLEFIPRPIHVNAVIHQNFSINEAKQVIYNAIIESMGYNNIYSKNSIGYLPTEDELRSYIISKTTNIGLVSLSLSDYSNSVITASDSSRAYHFTFDDATKNRLMDLEAKHDIFTNGDLSELMGITISITQQTVA